MSRLEFRGEGSHKETRVMGLSYSKTARWSQLESFWHNTSLRRTEQQTIMLTRKLSYRKDDCAMCPMYMGALKIFASSGQRPRPHFPKFLMSFCSVSAYKCACKIWNP